MKSRTFYALSFCATFGTVLAFIVAFVQLLHIQKPGKYAKVALKEKQDTAEFSVNEELAIGIDLGPSNCRVGIFRNNAFEIIPDAQGRIATPPYVSFLSDEPIVGSIARELAAHRPKSTVYGFWPLLGRNSTHENVRLLQKEAQFEIVDQRGSPRIKLHAYNQTQLIGTNEVLATIIGKLKGNAEAYLEHNVRYAVVTVPADFDEEQRRAVKDAGGLAGLQILRILNQPIAAGIAHKLESKSSLQDEGLMIFYHIDEYYCDVTIASIDRGIYEILSAVSSRTCGSHYFDSALLDTLIREYDLDNGGSISSDAGAIGRLKYEVDAAKKVLLGSDSTTIKIQHRRHIPSYTYPVTREDLYWIEKGNIEFDEIVPLVIRAQREAKVLNADINALIITGDPSHAPKFESALRNFYNLRQVMDGIPSNEAFVRGAARYAEILSSESVRSYGCPLFDISRVGLGIELEGGIFQKIIPRHHAVPLRRTINITSIVDNQSMIKVLIFEGERPLTKHNKVLGVLTMDKIQTSAVGESKFEVAFELDVNYILRVTLHEFSSGRQESVEIRSTADKNNYLHLEELGKLAEQQYDADISELEIMANTPHLRPGSDDGIKLDMKRDFDGQLETYKPSSIKP